MFKWVTYAIMAYLLVACGQHNNDTRFQEITFTANKESLSEADIPHDQAADENYGDAISLQAYLLPEPLVIKDIRNVSTSYGPEVDTLIQYSWAILNNDHERVLSYWYPNQRKRASLEWATPDQIERQKERLLQDPSLTVIGLLRHEDHDGDHVYSVLTKSEIVVGITVQTVARRTYLAHHYEVREQLDIVEAAFQSGALLNRNISP